MTPPSEYMVRERGRLEEEESVYSESPLDAPPHSPKSSGPTSSSEAATPFTRPHLDFRESELPSPIQRRNHFLETRRIILPCTPVNQRVVEENEYQQGLSEQLTACANLLEIFLQCCVEEMSDYNDSDRVLVADKIKTYTDLLSGNYGLVLNFSLKRRLMDVVGKMQERLLDPAWSSFFGLNEFHAALAIE